MASIIVYIIFAVSSSVEDELKEMVRLGERCYDATYFHDRVVRILIDDHNVPRLR